MLGGSCRTWKSLVDVVIVSGTWPTVDIYRQYLDAVMACFGCATGCGTNRVHAVQGPIMTLPAVRPRAC